MRKYYGMAGKNAYGVYDSYERVLKAGEYVAGMKCKRFNNFDMAKDWAEITYSDMQDESIFDYVIADIEKMNWCYYRKKVMD